MYQNILIIFDADFDLCYKLLELMGVGTASVVCPISEVLYEDEIMKVPTIEQKDPLFERLYHALTDIQYGRTPHHWSHIIQHKES